MTEVSILVKSEIIFRNRENLDRIITCVNRLNEHQLWYKTNSQTNSVANLILHLCGNITQYIQSSIGGENDERKRNLEFSVEKGINNTDLVQKITGCVNQANIIIEDCSEGRLIKNEKVQGIDMTGIGNLVHVCEHLSYHTGQIALLTKIMTNKDLGFYADLDLGQTN